MVCIHFVTNSLQQRGFVSFADSGCIEVCEKLLFVPSCITWNITRQKANNITPPNTEKKGSSISVRDADSLQSEAKFADWRCVSANDHLIINRNNLLFTAWKREQPLVFLLESIRSDRSDEESIATL